ncbi:MAG: AAA family ATPase [bacterium]|nr:AAA family ATPase [bacterium]
MNSETENQSQQLPPGYSYVETLSSDSHTKLMRVNAPERVSEFALMKLPGKHARDWNNWATRDSELSRWIEGDAVLPALELEEHRDRLLPVFENFAGQPLSALVRPEGLKLQAFLRLALRITGALAEIHKHDLIHNDLQPGNVLVNVQTGEIRITGFGRSRLSAIFEGGNPARIWSNLNYLSPEQTGRVNRPVDFRSDFYSLAAILYELLCGRPPFVADDDLEIIHAHVAHLPQPPHEIRPDVPPVLSEIILRNLTKSADDRYRSLAGLKADLKECLRQMRSVGSIQYFKPGAIDASERYYAPRRLFGREHELRQITADFERSAAGEPVCTLVAGYSGIGKSALVREMSVAVFKHRGNFIEGKFDQFQRDVPYHAVLQALRAFVRSILSGTEGQVREWKDRIGPALIHSGPVLGKVIPELEWLLGKQPAPAELGPTESSNRFYLAFIEFIEAVATTEQPLVLFLDDLQWADGPSFLLIQRLMQELPTGVALHLIGAYRSNEVDASHPLSLTLKKIADARADRSAPRLIQLGPLSDESINQFVAEALQIPADHAGSLAGIVASFSGGNPLFAGEFLRSLIEEGRLRFDRKNRAWEWDVDAIRALNLAENIVDFLREKIERLGPESRELLNTAACYGNHFNLPILLAAHPEHGARELHALIEPAARMGLILLIRNDLGAPDADSQHEFAYRFVHDRIQQVVYELLSEEDRRNKHLAIGRGMLHATPAQKLQEYIFDITNHLNLARAEIQDSALRLRLAGLNLQAGRKAIASIAYESATKLLGVGRELLPENAWSSEYKLQLAISEELARACQLNGEYERSERLVDEILAHATDPLHHVAAYETRIRTRNNQNHLADSITAARRCLKELGVKLPAKGTTPRLIRTLLSTKLTILLRGGGAAILRVPEMRNRRKRAAVRILNQIGSTAYQSDPDLFAIVLLLSARLSYRYGIAPDTPYAIGLYAVAHSGALASPYEANRYIGLAQTLLERPEHRGQRTRVTVLDGAFVRHWTAPLCESLPVLLEGAEAGRISGDAEFRGYALFFKDLNEFFSSGRLDPLSRDMRRHLQEFRRQRTSQSLYVLAIWLQTVHNLMADPQHNSGRLETKLCGEIFQQERQAPELADLSYQTAVAWVHQSNALLLFLDGQARSAVEQGGHAIEMIKSMNSASAVIPLYFIDGLSRLALCADESTPQGEIRGHLRAVARLRKKFKKWSQEAPQNQSHRRHVLDAEWHRVQRTPEQALHFYELAAQEAQQNDFLMDYAIICELAGRFCVQENRRSFARTYLDSAIQAYSEWGCGIKATQIAAEFSEVLESQAARAARPVAEKAETTVVDSAALTTPENSPQRSLDMTTVMKAVETISEEIHLDSLLDKLIHIVMENSGARRGALIVAENGRLSVAALRDLDAPEPPTMHGEQHKILAEYPDLPANLIQYVARTREIVLLDETDEQTNAQQFVSEARSGIQPTGSALCVPIVHQSQLFGVFYLENNLTTGVFDYARMEIIKFLNTHVAISLRNARLYREQQELTKSFARFLPNQFLEFLEKRDVREVELGDSVAQDMIVLFSDIRDFTTLSESMNANDNFRFLNSYFKRMEPAILRNQGFIDKFIGDAIMALFSYSPKNALIAAIDMRSELSAFNRHRLISGLAPLEVGIGLHAGDVMLGTVGSSNRMETTVIGDTVNLASRVESLTKRYSAPILLTGELYQKIKDPASLELREIDSVRVKGKTRPVVIYELYGADSQESRDQKNACLEAFAEALAEYRAGRFAQAQGGFARVAERAPLDSVAGIFQRRCEALTLQPPENWDGVLDM